MTPVIKFARLENGYNLPIPARATPGSAGFDLRAAVDVWIHEGYRRRVPTGFAVQIPDGHVGLICPRSGLAWRDGLTVLNAPGIIDADYRGELEVLLINLGRGLVHIERGDRIAQLVVVPAPLVGAIEVDALDETERKGGFGSTGIG